MKKTKFFINYLTLLKIEIYFMKTKKIDFRFIPHLSSKKKDIGRSTLYTVNGPLQYFHADIAFIKFLARSAVDTKYALLCVDLFTSKVYVYTMRKKSNLPQKMEIFYKEIQSKRNKNEKMRLQTDQEFQQNEIKELNLKYNVEMFSSRLRSGKAFAAEQKIREFKKILFKSRSLHKIF